MQHATVKLDRIYYIGRKRINHLQQSFPPKKISKKKRSCRLLFVCGCVVDSFFMWIACERIVVYIENGANFSIFRKKNNVI